MTPDEFDRHFECFLFSSLSDDDAAALQLSLQDPHWQHRWLELSDLEGSLSGEFGIRRNAASAAADLINVETPIAKTERGSESSGRKRRGRVSQWRIGLAIAASVMFALAGALYFRSIKQSSSAGAIATLEDVLGEVHVLRAGGREPARKGTSLSERDGLQTSSGARATMRYADGTTIALYGEAESRLWLRAPRPNAEAQGKQIALDVGSLDATVVPQPVATPLIVSTPHSEIKILGTQFTLKSSLTMVRLEVREGRVQMQRIVDGKTVEVGSGFFAVASRDVELAALPMPPVVPPATASGVSRPLFNGRDLSGWNISRGTWKVENGVVIGSGLPGKFARIEGTTSHTNGELVCKLRMTGARVAEVQFGGYRDYFTLHWGTLGVWKELRVRVTATEIRGTLDGNALQLDQVGAGDGKGLGVLSFYATAGATLEIKDAQWTNSER